MAADTPSTRAFTGRKTSTTGSGVVEPHTKFGGKRSSYPHLTPATATRAAHVTSTRAIATITGPESGKRYEVLQRFHQDDTAGSTPVHDRFIGVGEQGETYNIHSELNPALHHPRGFKPPVRGVSLEESRASTLSFSLGDASGDPPLSPRTRHRKLPDVGY